ncbi:hypothetical protein GLAREA_01640 [Glarea lozoyensis ATCC 20868]|uniref:Uncharacterized protein n=1 Tax=Glarea lozoyensis (strain ATCC 20868 / MF5171) TaxID=1116229 RepID=S3DGJ9_GLAL2|nr:uncharacterized protein GLAREA_01640 [Glarea lozoyensis ATCC 20868]EPE25728.1 hypothetical protein GLAREA_01640 [Glarea lozoyensis ATCC 20868]
MEASSSRRRSASQVARRRSNSSNSIQVHHEVTVISDREALARRDAPPVASDIRSYRPSSSRTYSDISTKGHDRRRSEPPYNPDRDKRPARERSDGGYSRRSSRDPGASQSNRESMRALADFLTRVPPPETNLVAENAEDDLKNRKNKGAKKSPFRILSKMRSKREKEPESVQRSDSNVSCKTGAGARYVPITISPEQTLSTQSSYQSMRDPDANYIRSGRASLTVLNPVAEARESGSFHMLMSGAQNGTFDYEREQRKMNATPTEDIIGAEAVKTLENFYRQQERRSKLARHASSQSMPSRYTRGFAPLSIITPLEHQHTEYSNSSGTVESSQTRSHSRGASSVSTAPSHHVSNVGVIPPRQTTRVPLGVPQEYVDNSVGPTDISTNDLRTHLNSASIITDGIQPIHGLNTAAATTSNLSEANMETHPPQSTSTAPSKTLIDVSGARVAIISRPATAPPSQTRPVKTQILKRHSTVGANTFLTTPTDNIDYDDYDFLPKTREEQVKIKKSRDMALLYMENTSSRRKSAPTVFGHDRAYSDVPMPKPLEYEKYEGGFTQLESSKKPQGIFATSKAPSASGMNGTEANENIERGLTATGLSQVVSDSPSLPRPGEYRGATSLAPGRERPDSGSVYSTHTPLQSMTESMTRQSSVRPRHSIHASKDSLCDKIVSDFSMISRNNSEPGAAKASSRASSIRPSNIERIKAQNMSEISLSPIRTVAEFPEYTGFVGDSDLSYSAPPPTSDRSVKRAYSTVSSQSVEQTSTHLVPESLLASDSDTLAVAALPTRLRGVPRHRSVESLKPPSTLEERRHDRRMKRNNVLKEKSPKTLELERRISRIERDNQILVRALTGIAAGVQELKLFYQPIDEEALR